MQEAFTLFWRTLLVYILLVVMTRLMGKREIGSLSPMDLVVAILLADAAILAVEDFSRSLWVGLIPAATLVAAEIALSFLTIRWPWLRDSVTGRPSLIIVNGRLNEKEMRRQRYSLIDLMTQLREKDVGTVASVQYAILEPNGGLSVFPYPEHRALTPADLGWKKPPAPPPLTLIMDGVVDPAALEVLGKDRPWLDAELRRNGVEQADVLLAQADDRGGLRFELRQQPRPRPERKR